MGSLAAECPDIAEEDQIIKINGEEVNSREDAKRLFSSCGEKITLLLARPQFCSNDDGFVEETTSFEYMERLSENPDDDDLDLRGGFRSKDDSGRVTSSDQRNSESSGHDTNSPDKGNTPPRKRPQIGLLSPIASPLRQPTPPLPGQLDISRYIVNRPAPCLTIPPPPPTEQTDAPATAEEPYYEDIARIVPKMGVRSNALRQSPRERLSPAPSPAPSPVSSPARKSACISSSKQQQYDNVKVEDTKEEKSLEDLYTQFADVMYTNKANLAHTMILQQKLFEQQRAASNKRKGHRVQQTPLAAAAASSTSGHASPHNTTTTSSNATTASSSSHEWVVKRRRDGTRYITRRQVASGRHAPLFRPATVAAQRAARKARVEEERAACTTDDDAELKVRKYYPRRNRLQRSRQGDSINRYAVGRRNDVSTVKEIHMHKENTLFSVTTV